MIKFLKNILDAFLFLLAGTILLPITAGFVVRYSLLVNRLDPFKKDFMDKLRLIDNSYSERYLKFFKWIKE